MPIKIVDDIGTWDSLGRVEPIFNQWIEFPDYSNSLSTTIKLVFGGELTNLKSYAYIRCIYLIGIQAVVGRWWKIYPKPTTEVILYPNPPEFEFLPRPVNRYFEIQKRHYYRQFIGTHLDRIWSVELQVFNNSIFAEPIPQEESGFLFDFF